MQEAAQQATAWHYSSCCLHSPIAYGAAGGRIQWQREEPVCGSCLVLDGGEACQVAQPQCSRRPRRRALFPGDFDTVNRLLHQEASLWKDRHGLSETKRVRQGAGGSGAHSIAA